MTTIYKQDYESKKEYQKAFRKLNKSNECKAKVDNGCGGTGWAFFSSQDEMRIWKNQK